MSSASAGPGASNSTALVVLRAARRLGSDLEAELQGADLGLDHWLVVDALSTGDGLTMAELQAATLIAGPTQTRVVDKLVSRSLVYREVDEFDRRKVRVYLSARGSALHDELRPAIEAAERSWLDLHGPAVRASIGSRQQTKSRSAH
ncbi:MULTISPECIES: MarR family winged helix-turn-helix transcriptional regulator [Mycobacteriaceae]|uniref:MarR family transcriptional regulator n=1 Tax=Mycolicibacterium neoaurum VKM Ac-1815D TaxID=700508 RepID=V5X7R7_MYCNE|nr:MULTISPECIES: MarR family transcriptional regulator [Mycobacteriaceae]AMO04402.1 transcriptional regulator [Mycolicibacterium neoaurum]AXK77314.1 MarR family transcriptional regulator [Mycolicibacterium neoaurum]KUM06505.1 transcriptional regulator [Mycolicibacterium neoaurum]MDO3403633.1 MarR family transcriptional regulator [Mycolicibacterium neoaurum]